MSERRASRDLANRLITHAHHSAGGLGVVEAAAMAIHRMSAELARLLGADGCQALLARVLGNARATHPALSEVRIVLGSDPHLELEEGLETQTPEDVAAGLETTLVELFDLLGRVIGDDLALQLAEMSMTNAMPNAAKSDEEDASQR